MEREREREREGGREGEGERDRAREGERGEGVERLKEKSIQVCILTRHNVTVLCLLTRDVRIILCLPRCSPTPYMLSSTSLHSRCILFDTVYIPASRYSTLIGRSFVSTSVTNTTYKSPPFDAVVHYL